MNNLSINAFSEFVKAIQLFLFNLYVIGCGLLMLLIASTSVGADEGSEHLIYLSLDEALSSALRQNPSLAEMQKRYEAANAVPAQMGALPDPMITFGAMNYPTDTFDREQEGMTQLQVGISQQLPFFGKRSFKEKGAEYMAEIAHLSVEEMRLALVSKVNSEWWELYYLDKAIETVEKNKGLLKQFIKVAETKYKTGEGLQQDVLLAQLELSKLFDKAIQLNTMRAKRAFQLNILMNKEPNEAIKITDLVSRDFPQLFSEEKLYELAKQHSPMLKKMDTMVSMSETQLSLAKRDYYPDFNVGVTYGDRVGDNSPVMGGERSDLVSLMVGVKVPLYAGSKQSKAVEQKSLEVQQNQFSLQDNKNRVLASVSSESATFSQAKEQLELFETGIIPQSKQTVASMLAGYQVNQVDFLNLVRSQIGLLNYELFYWRAFADAKTSLSRLQTIIGQDTIYE